MTIRPGRITDSGAIAALLTDLDYPVTEPSIGHQLQRHLSHPDATLLVAEQDNTVVGFISLHFIPQLGRPGDFCRISYFCVSPTARRQGIGAALEAQATALARTRGCDRIEVHCHSRRTQAHRFYHRQGYSESPKYLCKPL